jgi:dihydroceramidase
VVITSALAVWLIDQHACDVLHNLPFGIPNPQLHAWWHVLCGYNCHLGLQLSIGLREKVLNKTRLPQTIWYGEVWPITNRGGKDEKSED